MMTMKKAYYFLYINRSSTIFKQVLVRLASRLTSMWWNFACQCRRRDGSWMRSWVACCWCRCCCCCSYYWWTTCTSNTSFTTSKSSESSKNIDLMASLKEEKQQAIIIIILTWSDRDYANP